MADVEPTAIKKNFLIQGHLGALGRKTLALILAKFTFSASEASKKRFKNLLPLLPDDATDEVKPLEMIGFGAGLLNADDDVGKLALLGN